MHYIIIIYIYQCGGGGGGGAGGEGAQLAAVVAVVGVRWPTAARVVVSVHPPAAVHVLAGVVAVVGVGPAGVEKLGHLGEFALASAANVCKAGTIYGAIDDER